MLASFRSSQGNQDLERPHCSRATIQVAKSVAPFPWAMDMGCGMCILTVHIHSDGFALPPVKCLG